MGSAMILFCRRFLSGALALGCISLLAPYALRAQIDIGQISGEVLDNTNALVPGAKVMVTDEGNNVSRETPPNTSGYYTFPNLTVGVYSVTVEANGFQKYLQSGIHLNASDQLNVQVK